MREYKHRYQDDGQFNSSFGRTFGSGLASLCLVAIIVGPIIAIFVWWVVTRSPSESTERQVKQEQPAEVKSQKREPVPVVKIIKPETPEEKAAREETQRIAKAKADAEAAIAKKAQDEIDANKLYEKVTARAHLLEILAKYPDTRAAKLARERLDKLDKKK